MKKSFGGLLLSGLLILSGCSAAPETTEPESSTTTSSEEANAQTGTLQIYAAASLKGAFDDMIATFANDNPELEILPPVYDGSSTLATQIIEGAPADVFASADEANMEKITAEKLENSAPTIFATNDITVAVESGNPKNIGSLKDLEDPSVSVITCAPEVPCGAATQRLFDAEDITVSPVSEEQNVTAVATKIAAGEADAGLIYLTDVKASDGALEAIDTPVDSEITNYYPISALKASSNQAAADAFVTFVLSDKGQEILKEYGFGTEE